MVATSLLLILKQNVLTAFMKTCWDVGHTRRFNTTMRLNFLLSARSHSRASDWLSLSAVSRVFCVNLEKEVTAGGSANRDASQWGSLTLEYESLQISRVFILALIHSFAMASNTTLPICLPPTPPTPASLIPLLHPLSPNLSSLSLSLPRFCHPITPGLFSFSNFLPQWSWRQPLSPCLSYSSFSSILFLPSYQNNQFKSKAWIIYQIDFSFTH